MEIGELSVCVCVCVGGCVVLCVFVCVCVCVLCCVCATATLVEIFIALLLIMQPSHLVLVAKTIGTLSK